jgi:hypothetical protein
LPPNAAAPRPCGGTPSRARITLMESSM